MRHGQEPLTGAETQDIETASIPAAGTIYDCPNPPMGDPAEIVGIGRMSDQTARRKQGPRRSFISAAFAISVGAPLVGSPRLMDATERSEY
jgi:hypothetical protein